MGRNNMNLPEMIILKDFDKLMRARHATPETLAKASKVSLSTIYRVRRGKPVIAKLGEQLMKTLETYTFGHFKPGRMILPHKIREESQTVKPTYMNNFQYLDDSDKTHTLCYNSNFKLSRPCTKTEAEIDRQWEYNRMMGRR
jgi:uncharacterized protein YkvS